MGRFKKEDMTLEDISDKYDLNYSSLTATLVKEEFRNKYFLTYVSPKNQHQNKIANRIVQLGLNVDINSRKQISPLELDIFVSSHNFAIEYNGSHWHSEDRLPVQEAKEKHIKKLKLCREKGIRLFNIFEHNWYYREKQIFNFIKTILGVNSEKIMARKCMITNDNCKPFIEDNHIQGYGVRTLKYFNLEFNGEVVASMTASKHHRQNTDSNDVVLNRLCFKDRVNVQGGASRLFKYFKEWAKSEGYIRIISWSDNCWTEGEIYNILGFELDREYDPDYFYYDVKGKKYRSKQSQRKQATNCPEGMTERKWCQERGLYRIWDCGKKKWIYSL